MHPANGRPRRRVFGKFGGEEIGSPGERFQGVCVYVYEGQVEGIKDLEPLTSCATLANF